MILSTALTMEIMDITHTFMCWHVFYPEYNKRMEIISQSTKLFMGMDCGMELVPMS